MSQEIIILNDKLVACIRDHLKPEEVTQNLLSLVRVAIIAHENAFHFSKNGTKNTYIGHVSSGWDEGTSGDEPKTQLKFNTSSPFISNIISSFSGARHHALNFPLVTKASFLQFVSDAWDTGEHQRKIYNFEIEGSINNEFGVALNFACSIALFGERKGLAPKEYENLRTPLL